VLVTLPRLRIGKRSILGPVDKSDGQIPPARYIGQTQTGLKLFHRRAEEDNMAEYAKDVLVDTQWVENHLSDDGIRIVEVDENPALYAEAQFLGFFLVFWKFVI
jgi:hypothetical protein